ncbi:MAG: hypothetical protein IMW92_14285, partial [Bacillales bacterium]|nr:hypothetical protein [Bacillales bacterium]
MFRTSNHVYRKKSHEKGGMSVRRLWRTATATAVLSFAVTGYALADGLP